MLDFFESPYERHRRMRRRAYGLPTTRNAFDPCVQRFMLAATAASLFIGAALIAIGGVS